MDTPAELVAFIEREQPRLVRAANLLVGDRAVAEEIAQEALLRASSRWGKVSRLASPGGWVHRVTVNLATSQLRRWRVERRARARLAPGDAAVDPSGPPDTAAAVEVRKALATLPESGRRRLVLRYVLDWTAEEIGEFEGASAATVRQRLLRSRAALREALGPGFDIADEPAETTGSNHTTGETTASRTASYRVTGGPHDEEGSDVR